MLKFQNIDREAIYSKSKLSKKYKRQSFASRFLTYQKERIPILQVFTINILLLSGIGLLLNNYDLLRVLLGSIVATLYLLQIRLSDEPKDFEHDNVHYPKRPVQRGLITLNELRNTGRVVIVLFLLICATLGSLPILLTALAQQAYAFLTRKEFYLRDQLRPHFIVYNLIHYIQLFILTALIMQIIAVPREDILPFYVLSILLIFMVDIARKTTDDEKSPAEDTYSSTLGLKGASLLFFVWSLAAIGWTVFVIDEYSSINTYASLAIVAASVALVWSCMTFLSPKKGDKTKDSAIQSGAGLVFFACCIGMISSVI